ncbi:ATP-binding protein [Streptomyces sp. NPDC048623]|uniref:ATP-binding protein n=1 Tax=Streptomyces sp. NPDC048623 TaxID=3155761 RepID=UPI003429EAA4
MSLPLTRRIAQVALLVAAGAAPVVAAAGSASAADQSLAPTNALTGLTSLDKTGAEGALGTATGVASKVPATQKLTGATGQATDTVGRTTGAVAEKAEAPTGGALGGLPTGQLPTNGLMGGLPIGG